MRLAFAPILALWCSDAVPCAQDAFRIHTIETRPTRLLAISSRRRQARSGLPPRRCTPPRCRPRPLSHSPGSAPLAGPEVQIRSGGPRLSEDSPQIPFLVGSSRSCYHDGGHVRRRHVAEPRHVYGSQRRAQPPPPARPNQPPTAYLAGYKTRPTDRRLRAPPHRHRRAAALQSGSSVGVAVSVSVGITVGAEQFRHLQLHKQFPRHRRHQSCSRLRRRRRRCTCSSNRCPRR